MTEENHLHAVARPTLDLAGDRPGLVFTVGVEQARLLCALLCRYKPDCARWVSGTTDPVERRQTVDRYRKGQVQFLCNCGVFLEGFDAPETALVVMARPTKSLTLYAQVLGRATRPLPGLVDGLGDAGQRKAAILASPKAAATVLDFVGNVERHRKNLTVTAADLLGGRYGQEVRAYAQQTIEEEQSTAGVEEALDRADAEMALLAEETERRRRIQAEASYRVQDAGEMGDGARRVATTPADRGDNEPATAKQLWKLASLGIPRQLAQTWTKRRASKTIGRLLGERSRV